MNKKLLVWCALSIITCLNSRNVIRKTIDETTHFTVVIPSYNNEQWFEKNLGSVFSQNYSNFNVIYIDDNSQDGTVAGVTNYIAQHKLEDKVTLITNRSRMGQLANRYRAAHLSDDDSVLVMLDGDDWFAHHNVLKLLNTIYSTKKIWLTYGQYQRWCSHCQENPLRATEKCKHIHGKGRSAQIPPKIMNNNSIRTHKWITTHLRTFKAWLFKQIPLRDLHHRGRLFEVGTDIATMIPMVEMAGEHTHFIDQVLYIYNRDNPVSCWKPGAPTIVKTDTQGIVRRGKKYEPLSEKAISPDIALRIHGRNLASSLPKRNHIATIVNNRFNCPVDQASYILLLKDRFELSQEELMPYIRALEQTKSRAIILDVKAKIAQEILPHGLLDSIKVGIPHTSLDKYNNILIRSSDFDETTSIEQMLQKTIGPNDTVIYL